ncbi:het-domain protein [Diaporthe amygdali]|uniref:het-domain protein n=1 Tax=Phomopsis amygdali TaxID=1214568 RepID=UPI0022FEE77B|nr:het-domain protein [Diaporthe amygdali]KAJ0125450.1 het-domain protein [Diaporthe amygdali]
MAASADLPSALAQLCKICRQLEDFDTILECRPDDPSDRDLWAYDDQWPGLPHLEASANSGCDFCRLLRETLLSAPERQSWPNGSLAGVRIQISRATYDDCDYNPLRLYGLEASLLGYTPSFGGTLQGFEVRKVVFQAWTKEQKVKLSASVDGRSILRRFRVADLLTSKSAEAVFPLFTSLSPEVLSKRNIRFMRDAIAAHQHKFYTSEEHGFLPTRLLDLGEDTATVKKLHLVLRDEMPKTQAHNANDPRRNRDALCILQGGEETEVQDWDRESQQMCDVFGNAYFTICAVSLKSCQDRFLSKRCEVLPALNIHFKSKHCIGGQSQSSYCMAPCSESDLYRSNWIGELENSRWHSRGWVYQELAMSPRLIIFTRYGIVFSSAESYVCEDGTDSIWTSYRLGRIPDRRLAKSPFSKFAIDVRQISTKQFTHETDRLPATTSLARRVADLTGSEYLAGLFKDDLARALLFYKERADIRQSFHERLRQLSEPGSISRPSWSWAGLPGPSHHTGPKSPHRIEEIELIEAVAVRRDETSFGRVLGGYLKIRVGMISLRDWVKGDEDVAEQALQGGYLNDSRGEMVQICWDTYNSEAVDILIDAVYLLRIMEEPAFEVHGLFVYPAERGGEFYRFGYWRVDPWVDEQVNWEMRTISLL